MAKGACRCSPCSCQGTGTPSPSLPASSPPASHSQGFPSALRQRHIIINLLLKQPLHSSHIHRFFYQPWGQRHFYYQPSYAASSPSTSHSQGFPPALETKTLLLSTFLSSILSICLTFTGFSARPVHRDRLLYYQPAS